MVVLAASVLAGCTSSSEPRPDGTGSATSTSTRSAIAGSTQRFSQLPAYEGVSFADALQRDEESYLSGLRNDPDVGYTAEDYDGQYTTVRDDVRQTIRSTCDCPKVRLWLVGGSAAFGLGQRDEHTIASELVRLAAADGIDLEVENLGVPGRTIWQEYQDLLQRLQRDDAHAPDVIVSYGGFNDALGGLMGAVSGDTSRDHPNVLDEQQAAAFAAEGYRLPSDLTIAETAALAADRYRRSQDLIDGLAAERGIVTEYVFHPDALASPGQAASVIDAYEGVTAEGAKTAGEQLEAVSQSLDGTVWNLRHLYDDEAPVFVDWAHTNEVGSRLAARAVYDLLAPDLQAAARGS